MDFTQQHLADSPLTAVRRLDWQPAELASYLVDRYLCENWHPVHWGPDLYVTDLGNPFRLALFKEIDTRLAALPRPATEETEAIREDLNELRVNSAACANS